MLFEEKVYGRRTTDARRTPHKPIKIPHLETSAQVSLKTLTSYNRLFLLQSNLLNNNRIMYVCTYYCVDTVSVTSA